MKPEMKEEIVKRGGVFIKTTDGKTEECVKFPSGTVIMKKGEPPDVFYWIKTGIVDIIKEKELVIAESGPGDFIGEIAFQIVFILGKKAERAATVRAKTEVIALPISGNIFEKLGELRIGLLRKLFIQAIKREDHLLGEIEECKAEINELRRQKNQFQGQLTRINKALKEVKSLLIDSEVS